MGGIEWLLPNKSARWYRASLFLWRCSPVPLNPPKFESMLAKKGSNNMKNFRKWLVLISLTLLLGNARAESSGIGIVDLQSSRDDNGVPVISGVAVNQTGKLVKTAFVNFNLYDDQGNVVGSTSGYVSNLAPGERWKFKIVAPQPGFVQFRLTGVQTYDN